MSKINRKYILVWALIILLALSWVVYTCSRSEKSVAPSAGIHLDLKRIKARGKLVVLTENNAISYFIYRGRKMGFEYDILKEFAASLNVELEIKILKNIDDAVKELNEGKGDILACNYTVTRERKKHIQFSIPYLRTSQVLVQRKPKGWRTMKKRVLDDSLITDPIDLALKKVHVWENSSYYKRLISLMDEIGDTIYLVPESGAVETEDLIEQVANGEIDYTVVDKNIAEINQRFYSNIDTRVELSIRQQIAFGIAKENVTLKNAINDWLRSFVSSKLYSFLKHKYFDTNTFADRSQGEYSSNGGKKISPYDELFKKEAKRIHIDWRLLAALVYQESKFNDSLTGMGGAYGLMQFMPATGERFGVFPDSPPEVQIHGGASYIHHIFKLWNSIEQPDERVKFCLASYNAGAGHIIDAQQLAEKHDKNPQVWTNSVEVIVLKMANPTYYQDEVVKNGRFRGARVVDYVEDVYTRYIEYKTAFPD